MKDHSKKLKKWLKEHKEELIAAGVSIGTIIFFYKFLQTRGVKDLIDFDMEPLEDGEHLITMIRKRNNKVITKLQRKLSKNDADSLLVYLLSTSGYFKDVVQF